MPAIARSLARAARVDSFHPCHLGCEDSKSERARERESERARERESERAIESERESVCERESLFFSFSSRMHILETSARAESAVHVSN